MLPPFVNRMDCSLGLLYSYLFDPAFGAVNWPR